MSMACPSSCVVSQKYEIAARTTPEALLHLLPFLSTSLLAPPPVGHLLIMLLRLFAMLIRLCVEPWLCTVLGRTVRGVVV